MEQSLIRLLQALLIMLALVLCGLMSALAMPALAPALDPACIRFDDPNAVVNGEIAYVSFTAYETGLDHAVAAWSAERGFAIPLREVVPSADEVPAAANLIYRDVAIPRAGFKGVTVTWTNAPATITLNRATMPPPDTADPVEQDVILAVVTHETGHALGLGDVPAPGVNIRECGNMLMKRSVDKAGGHITEPQPGDIALYCLRWDGPICGDNPIPTITPGRPPAPSPVPMASPAVAAPASQATTYRYFVVKCEHIPASAITPELVERDRLPGDAPRGCVRAPAGVMFHARLDNGIEQIALTDRRGEFTIQKPAGVAVDVELPHGSAGRFPSLLGYRPLHAVDHIPTNDPDCTPLPAPVCKRVFVLVP